MLGAFLITGVLILVVSLTGRVRAVMAALPPPIVMGMVAGLLFSLSSERRDFRAEATRLPLVEEPVAARSVGESGGSGDGVGLQGCQPVEVLVVECIVLGEALLFEN